MFCASTRVAGACQSLLEHLTGFFCRGGVLLKGNLLSSCPYFNLLVWRVVDLKTVKMTRLRCKSWTCLYCNKKTRDEWSSHLKKRLPRVAVKWWFVTLTAHENLRDAKHSLANIRDNIDRLMKRLRRIFERISYVRVYEKHKSGAFHAHLLVAGMSDRVTRSLARNKQLFFRPKTDTDDTRSWGIKTWWKRRAREMGMGYMVDVQALETCTQSVNYVLKYLTKEGQAFEQKGLRRIQTTTDIGSPHRKPEAGWNPAKWVTRWDVPPGATLYDLNEKVRIDREYWQDNDVYPPDVDK